MAEVEGQAHLQLPPFQRHSDTSRAAAVAQVPLAERGRARVLEALRRHGGLTDSELEDLTGLPGSTERPRRVELVRAGLVEDSGDRRRTPSGRTAVVWRARG